MAKLTGIPKTNITASKTMIPTIPTIARSNYGASLWLKNNFKKSINRTKASKKQPSPTP